MNAIETAKIRRALKEWTERAIRDGHYPVMLITMANEKDIRIERIAEYSNHQVKQFLQGLIDSLPE